MERHLMEVTVHSVDGIPSRLMIVEHGWGQTRRYEVCEVTGHEKRVIKETLEFDEALRIIFGEIKTVRQDKY